MKCELCFDDCLDLPSLTQIKGDGEWIHSTTFIIHEDIVNTFEVLAQVGEHLHQ